MDIKNRLVALALGASLGLASQAAGFFHDNYKRLEPKRIEISIVERCKGDFYVFEELQPEPIEPFIAVLNAKDFKEGILEGGVKVRIEKNKRLEDYLSILKKVNNEHNYGLIDENVAGRYICGMQHLKPDIYVDVKEKRIDVKGTTKDSGGGGGGGAAGGGSGGMCLLHNSLVLVNNNKCKKIQNLRIGDSVLSLDLINDKITKTKISKIIKNHSRNYYFRINQKLCITNDHPILVSDGSKLFWITVEDLKIGDYIKSINDYIRVEIIERIEKSAMTVYMETESGNFIVKAGNYFYIVKSTYAPNNFEGFDLLEQEISI